MKLYLVNHCNLLQLLIPQYFYVSVMPSIHAEYIALCNKTLYIYTKRQLLYTLWVGLWFYFNLSSCLLKICEVWRGRAVHLSFVCLTFKLQLPSVGSCINNKESSCNLDHGCSRKVSYRITAKNYRLLGCTGNAFISMTSYTNKWLWYISDRLEKCVAAKMLKQEIMRPKI